MEIILWAAPVVILFAILIWLKTPQGIGTVGEWRIRFALGKNIENERYIINNLILKGENGRTSQIDHVLINSNGVYVIETKNYSGRIYGSDEQLEWTQTLKFGKVKNKLYNPVKQNATHVYRIKQLIEKGIPVFSVVVFVRGNTEYIKSEAVYDVAKLKALINGKNEKSLSAKQINEIHTVLSDVKKNCNVSNYQHIKNIENMQNDIKSGICPRCGSKLVERNGAKGKFLGCSGYPKCKFTKKVEEQENQ